MFPHLALHPLLAGLQLLGDEGERNISHFMPAVVNGQGVSAIGYFVELGDPRIALLQLVLSFDDRQWNRMVFLARNEQEGTTRGIPGVDTVFGPWVEVGGNSLEEGCAGTGDCILVVKLVGFAFLQHIGKAVPELLVGQGNSPVIVGGIAQDWSAYLEFGERHWQYTAKACRIDSNCHGR